MIQSTTSDSEVQFRTGSGPEADGPATTGVLARLRFWAGRGSVAFLDQALTSGTNFALSILLARYLAAPEYGAYAVTYAVFLLIANLYQGALMIPSMVLGPTTYAACQAGYIAAMVRIHGLLAVACAVVLLAAAAVCSWAGFGTELPGCLAAMAVATPAVLLQWLIRGSWYLRLEPVPAAWGAALYAILLIPGVLALQTWGLLTAVTGILMMGAAGLVSGLWLLIRIRPAWDASLTMREVWRESWRYGRWELGIALAAWLPSSFCYPVTASVLGEAQAGVLRALQNFALPVTQALTSVLRLAQPYLSARFGHDGQAPARPVWLLTTLAVAGASLYLGVVFVLREPLMNILYHGKFSDSIELLPFFILPVVLAAGTESVGLGLRAMRRSNRLLLGYVAASIVYVATGVLAARAAGLSGVAATLVLANLASFLTVALLFRHDCARAARQANQGGAAPR